MRFKTFYLQETENAIPKILYHGSNYDFSKFDLKYIGKGEGLQKFGYGVYLTDTEELSNFYATQLKGTQIIYQCRIPSDSRLYEWGSPVDDFLHNKYIRYLNDNDFEKDAEKLQDEYEQYNEYMEFENYYKILSHLVESPKKASEIFVDLGVDGCIANDIKNRGKIYVIFEASLIKIIDKDILNESNEQLNEASKELNLISFLSDKISKTLDEISRNPEQFKKYKPNNSGQFVIPFKKFIGDLDVPRNSFIKFISYGKLFLDYGSTKDSTYPYLEVISHKDGRNIRKKAGGYYDNEFNPDIHLPFINQKTDLPFQGYSKHWKSLLTHELTHANQDFNRKITTGTSQLSTEEWFSNKIEQEAILHQIYKPIQKYIKSLFSEMEYKRTADGKYKDIKSAINISNSLFKWFESFESFKRSLRMSLNVIFLDYESTKTRYLYLWDNHKDVYNKFLEDSYYELKKEFKNVIPTKELKYEKESK